MDGLAARELQRSGRLDWRRIKIDMGMLCADRNQ